MYTYDPTLTLEEAKKLRCEDCPHYVDKGDEEKYCVIAHWRMFTLAPHQKKPGFCPKAKRARMEAKRNEDRA